MASPSNGGIIGKSNRASFGKNTTTTKTATTTFTLQPGTRQIQTLLVGGGGAGGTRLGGGGGGGGYRCVTNIQLSTNSVPIVVGAGGAGTGYNVNPGASEPTYVTGVCGAVTSAGGGGGGPLSGCSGPVKDGGSGGGSSYGGTVGGTGNSPPVSPPQGNPGGRGINNGPGHAS